MNKLLMGACLTMAMQVGHSQTLPQLGKDPIEKIVAAMTAEEKVSLLVGTGMPGFGGQSAVVGSTQNIVPGAAGTTFPIERLGIPAIVVADGPAGLRISPTREGNEATYYCTAFPVATLLASTWENTDPDALKAYSSTLEETRADLFGLYYLADPKLVELGLLPDGEAYKSEYYKYIMNGLMTQLVRIELGKNVEEAHMRNRQLIAKWAYEKGKEANVIELKKRDGKTYVVVNDYPRLRELFGTLLAEIQRIKSEGDYAAGKNLVEGYGVKVDPELHAEVLERYAKLNLAPYKGFVNPVMREVKNSNGEVTDIVLDYTEGYTDQMLRYGRDYSFLPTYND